MTKPLSRRERTHAATAAEIKAVSRRLMVEQGTASLNLRSVARDMGMTPSALYRYFDSRDALLTALIIESYDDVGSVAEHAAATIPADCHPLDAFMTVAHAFREWAVKQPHAFGLLFGARVPGYEAPPESLGHALRVSTVLLDLLRSTLDAGLELPVKDGDLPPALGAAMAQDCEGKFSGMSLAATAIALACWSTLLGAISAEVFAHMPPQAELAPREMFTFTMERALLSAGLPPRP